MSAKKQAAAMDAHDLSLWWYDEFRACGCGQPDAVATLLRDVMRALNRSGASSEVWAASWERIKALLPDPGVHFFVMYRLSDLDIEEHGGSSPGWLTPKGERILAALEEYGVDVEKWGDHSDNSSDGKCDCGREVSRL